MVCVNKFGKFVTFLDKISSDVLFILLGFVLGATFGSALFIILLPNPAQYGGAFITAGGSIFAATVGALMIRHQLRENFRNSQKIEKIKLVSDPDCAEKLKALYKLIRQVEMRLTEINFFIKEGVEPSKTKISHNIHDNTFSLSDEIGKLLPVLAPISGLYRTATLHLMKSIMEAEARYFDGQDVAVWIEKDLANIHEVRVELSNLLLFKTEAQIFTTDWTNVDEADWKMTLRGLL